MYKCLCLFFIAVFLVSFSSCKTAEPMTMAHPDRIEFGSFGGFAGSYTEYKVVPDGHAWKQARLKGPVTQLEDIDPTIVAQLIAVIEDQRQQGYQINNPGNMTHFIRLCKEGEQNYELVWGGGETVDPRVKKIHKTLVKLSKEYHHTR